MSNNIDLSSQNSTYFFALGGIEEIGKNMYVVEHKNEIFIIDCGCKFCDENDLPGVDLIICPFNYLVENREKVKGLIITHAHEDHIGGVPYLLKIINIPVIYGSSLSNRIIKKKMKEHSGIFEPKFVDIIDDTIIKTQYFNIDFFRVCHSIPLCYGLCINTPNGNIVTCGDFRFDFSEKMEQTDIHKICSISKRGVDLLLCETTNANVKGFSDSEELVINEIRRQIINAKGRVLITTFASNLNRIENIIEIAINQGRRICIIGKSMSANIDISKQLGLIKTYKQDFVEPTEIKNIPDKNILIILTGSQGEERAALNMIAEGRYPHIIFKPTDLLLMSSNPIPGNYNSVETLVNKLSKCNIQIVQNSPTVKIHASGHATQTELALMIKLIKPKYIIPIHGEFNMLKTLCKTAQHLGIKGENLIQITNGQKVELLNHVVTPTNIFINANEVYTEGLKINSNNSKILQIRQVIGTNGIINVTVVIDRKLKKIIDLPKLITRGCFYSNTSINLIKKICFSIKDNLELEMNKQPSLISDKSIKQIIESTVSYYIWKNKSKRPLIKSTIFENKQDI